MCTGGCTTPGNCCLNYTVFKSVGNKLPAVRLLSRFERYRRQSRCAVILRTSLSSLEEHGHGARDHQPGSRCSQEKLLSGPHPRNHCVWRMRGGGILLCSILCSSLTLPPATHQGLGQSAAEIYSLWRSPRPQRTRSINQAVA